MPVTTFNRMLSEAALAGRAIREPRLRPNPLISLPALDRDELRGRTEGSGGGRDPAPARLGKTLDARLGTRRRFGFREGRGSSGAFDARQRAIVKIHFFGHGGGGAAALKAHARYVARDGAGRDAAELTAEPAPDLRVHGAYLRGERNEARGLFYDGLEDDVDGAARMAVWAREDRRHFRIILAPENGAALSDLKPYVRDVMERAEAMLGTRLEWVAIDHWDTDNPHTHLVLRGRRGDGRPLVLAREFVKHGMRSAARDAATERLGPRTREDERLALEREARAHRPSRLDAMLERQAGRDGVLRLALVEAPNGDPALTNALKTRARELVRLGLATERRRNVLALESAWRERLSAMELHLDIRKQIMQSRAVSRAPGRRLGRDGFMER